MAFTVTKVVIFLFLYISIIDNVCYASIENIDLNYTQPAAGFDELYTDGVDLYTNESWEEAIRSFQLALADYRHESEVRANCLLQCREKADKSDILRNGLYDGGSLALYYAIRVRRCCDLCQETYLGRRSPVAQFIRDAFEKREPYHYLQFCYFKLKQYQKAADAAFTFLERNPTDSVMLTNFKVYSNKYNASRTAVKSLEAGPHIALFVKGDKEYVSDQFTDCVHTFEASLDEYYKEHKKCQALCEYQHRKHQASFSVALFSHQTAIVQCRLSCADKLTTFNGSRREKLLEDHYHYLQFCYFEIGRLKEAAACTKTYLLFHPNDPIMAANMNFYLSSLPKNSAEIAARKRAEKYLRQQVLDEKLLKVAKYYVNPDLMFANDVPELFDLEDPSTVVSKDSAYQKQVEKTVDSGSMEEDNSESIKQVKGSSRWKKNPLFKGVKLFKEGKDLNGTNRFVVDNISSAKECTNLITLLQKLSKFGDGYKHNHADPKHPFTDKETFEGVSIGDAVKAAVNEEISIEEAQLYADLSEKMRLFVADYFNLKKPLYISFTHLVCRTAADDANDGTDHVSHPIHSDNCILGEDGTCPKIHPAYTWRDFSGVLYLNDNFKGGNFIFADPLRNIQATVEPKCGRMVAFTGGIKNLHGVLGVKSGRRCALPLWFTYQKGKVEDSREKYLEILNKLKKQKGQSAPKKDSGLGQLSARVTRLSDSVAAGDSQKSDLGSHIRSEL